mgnify:CR=1 FL=1
MKWFRWILVISFTGGIYVGCADVKFNKEPSDSCVAVGPDDCKVGGNKETYDYDLEIGFPQVDILFVNDNSASMTTEQKKLAQRFANFIQALNTQAIDYRIAITTTDISSEKNPAREINKQGALQDGKLIKFSNGEYFLTSRSGTLARQVELFNEQIARPETKQCDDFITNWTATASGTTYSQAYLENCPSQDERGIYAANLVAKNNPESFLREKAKFALIIVSDEDERSQLYYYNYDNFLLEPQDDPRGFVNAFRSKYPQKSIATYPIIVATESCKTQQDNQVHGVRSSYGLKYDELVNITGGVVGDICSANYTNQLGKISASILEKINSVELNCTSPIDLKIEFSGTSKDLPYTIEGKSVKFSKDLPAGTRLHLNYSCR